MLRFFQPSPNRLPAISFELFPPKSVAGEASLYENVERLMVFEPVLITCTYGAGGSTQAKTLEIVEQIKSRFRVPVASHLTVVGNTVDGLRDYLRQAEQLNVDSIVALRGDPPVGAKEFRATEGGLQYANQLVDLIRAEFKSFDVLVAGYPEKHREAPNADLDLDNLKRKVDAGADAVVTQLFYENDDFFRFRDRCAARGIRVPIIPGLLPVTNLQQVQRITALCDAKLPTSFVSRLEENDDPQWQLQVGIDKAIEQVNGLMAAGVPGLHFYVLNRSDATTRILESLNPQLSIESEL
jgi:methylenetetrahydrofolate reductase (NADPH)